jgi:hypothetical protein
MKEDTTTGVANDSVSSVGDEGFLAVIIFAVWETDGKFIWATPP